MPLGSVSNEAHEQAELFSVSTDIVGSKKDFNQESVSSKILRELDLLGSVGTGFKAEAGKAYENLGETSLKVTGSSVVGLGLALASRKPGMIALGAQSFGLAGGVSFGIEVVQHGAEVMSAAHSSWQSDLNHENNKRVVGNTTGAFFFDTALMGVAGSAGAIGTHSYLVSRANSKLDIPVVKLGEEASFDLKLTVPKYGELGQLYGQMTNKVGRIEVLAQTEQGLEGRMATVFAFGQKGKGTMVTNHHVIKNALDVTVFDRFGQPHKAAVLNSSPVGDIAVIQLQSAKEAAMFTEIAPVGSNIIKKNVAGEPLYAVGYTEGWRKLFLSQGETINALRVDTLNMHIKMHCEEGNCGSPIFDDRGGLVGIFKQGDRTNHDVAILTPVERVNDLLSATKVVSPSFVPPPVMSRQHYEITDSKAAAANVEKLFALNDRIDNSSEFFHSKITRVLMPPDGSRISELILRSQYQPPTRQIVVEALALDGKAIASDMVWPGSNIPINSAKLTLSLNRAQQPFKMESINDPNMFLRKAFEFKSVGNYLANVEPIAKTVSLKTRAKLSVAHIVEWLDSTVHSW